MPKQEMWFNVRLSFVDDHCDIHIQGCKAGGNVFAQKHTVPAPHQLHHPTGIYTQILSTMCAALINVVLETDPTHAAG